jgi:hypothetical protein
MLYEKLKNGENFAFSRFSDGELFILENQKLVLAENHSFFKGQRHFGRYPKEEQKEFLPEEHSFYRQKLLESLQFKKNNYFKGITCPCCGGDQAVQYMKDLHGGEDDSLTWANIFCNSNYKLFVEKMMPALSKKKIVLVCNEIADISGLPLEVVKDFRVGSNCLINDYGLVEEVRQWIEDNKIKNHVFLFSASTLSNYLAHQLYEFEDENTYLDIGSTISPYLKMEGWKHSRDYLVRYWMNTPTQFGDRVCAW